MNLRAKLLLAQLPLVLAVAILGIVSVLTVGVLGETAENILRDNYRSVLAAQRMKESAERMDSAALFIVAGAANEASEQILRHRPLFEQELLAQEDNLTELDEGAVTGRLRSAWHEYQQAFDAFAARPSAGAYFGDLQPRFSVLKAAADEVLALNQDAMVRKSDNAREGARSAERVVVGASITALLLGIAASVSITSRVLRPLDNLALVVRRLGEGDRSVRATVMGSGEIAALALEFNEMAAKLEAFHKSSLGELLRAQLAAQATIDSIPDPVLVFTVEGTILSSNECADEVLHLGAAHHESPPLALVDPVLRRAIERVRDHVLSGHGPYVPRGYDDAVMVQGGEGERWFLPRSTPLYGADEGISGVTVIVQDVSRLRRFDELRNDLVATVAHEFRTPLTSLRMAIHLCVEGAAGDLTPKQLDLLGAAREDCERLQTIVDDLLDLARLRAGKIELELRPSRPDILVARALEKARQDAQQRGITLRSDIVPSLDDILVDETRIQLVFDNFLANALRHTPAGGHVTVSAEPYSGLVRFEVRDTGPGIDAEHLPRLFERFYRVPGSTTPGAGLGLSIAREIVEAHGGEIGAASLPGEGSTFWFTLAHAPPPARMP